MGRPSRKEVATSVIYEDPNDGVLYFSIDKKGNSSYIGNQPFILPHNSLNSNLNSNIKFIQDSSENELNENDKKKITSNEKKEKNSKPKTPKFYIEMSGFDDFLNSLDSQMSMESFLKNHRLSDNMLPNFD